jgi:hypothetical protein
MKKPIEKLAEFEAEFDATLHFFVTASLFFFAAFCHVFFRVFGG